MFTKFQFGTQGKKGHLMRSMAIFVALATTAMATPAVASDHSWYAGVEGGLMIVEDNDFDVSFVRNGAPVESPAFFSLDHKRGIDLDLIGGYDFGVVRAEFEAGYKRASVDAIGFSSGSRADVDGNVRVYSAMANVLLDFGGEDGWAGYVGGGAGLANVRYKLNFIDPASVGGSGSDSDRTFAWQGIAGVRKSLNSNVDLGLKYRYFVASNLDFDIVDGEASSRYKSHSLLASLIFNFAPPPAPVIVEPVVAPPPPPPPATQTCYDGSVILATDVCPQPPVETPPPPPAPAPERG
jgi:opacity protein-like surface antigen